MSSFFIPLGALNATSTAVSAVGNNLANLNTTGYKNSTVTFSDMMSQQIGGTVAASQVGMGVAAPLVKHQFSQGAIQSTGGDFDAAIQGNGFFIVKNPEGTTGYTRAGNFTLDQAGNLVTSSGAAVQGWMGTGGVVSPSGAVTNITIPASSLQIPVPTTKFSVSANLDASAATNATFSTPMQVVDSLGANHTLTVTYTKTGPNAWSYDVTIPGDDLKGGTAGTATSVAKGNLTFDTAGKLLTPAATAAPVAVNVTNFANGAANQNMGWNLYNTDLTSTTTQFTQASAASGTTQDGLTSAQPVKIQMGANGVIVAQYSNGKTIKVAQVAVAGISNPESLYAVGNNEFALGANTAAPSIGAANTGGRGAVIGNSLEASTVDIATEFTNLMQFQRSYQANSKVITTMDELAQDVINIKR